MVVLLNKGQRTWDLHDAVEVNGKLVRRKPNASGAFDPKEKVIKRRLPPGGSIEAVDQAEAEQMLQHSREIVDAEKAVPAIGDKTKALEVQVKALELEIQELKDKLAQYEDDGEGDEKKGNKKK